MPLSSSAPCEPRATLATVIDIAVGVDDSIWYISKEYEKTTGNYVYNIDPKYSAGSDVLTK